MGLPRIGFVGALSARALGVDPADPLRPTECLRVAQATARHAAGRTLDVFGPTSGGAAVCRDG